MSISKVSRVQQVAEDESADGVEHHRRGTDCGIGGCDVAPVARDLEAAGEPAVHPSLDLSLGALQLSLAPACAGRLEHGLPRGVAGGIVARQAGQEERLRLIHRLEALQQRDDLVLVRPEVRFMPIGS